VYLCSLRKPFGKRLGTFEDDELHSFTTFRDNLILRTLIKVKRISAKSAAKRFNVTSKTIFNIVRKLREEGRLEVVNNYIVIKLREMQRISYRKGSEFKQESRARRKLILRSR
jgi:DeoR/GlpR family transcriptional regulator of sugar metabolism